MDCLRSQADELMRYDPNKTYLYPVLRPSSTDYPRTAFEVEIYDPERISGTTSLRVSAEFYLSDPDLLSLVDSGVATYALRIRAPATRHRSVCCSFTSEISRVFYDGQLHGRTEIWGFLVAMDHLPGFRAESWHDDYAGLHFDIPAGSVLAQDVPKEYWVDTAEEAPIGSIIQIRSNASAADGAWECQLDGERVTVLLSLQDYKRFENARTRLDGTKDAAYIKNAVYLPALIYVLQEADRGVAEYADRRWYRSLDKRLDDCECRPLGSESSSRLVDAQLLLEQPFAELPLMSEDE